jgi:DNA-binding NarL/FixJ family response regulator
VRPELQIICEARDGPHAVQKAEELTPDLILLDIGLPKMNGLEAARRIRKLAPDSKILFLTQESSADVVREALSLGALGYVVKAHAGTELLPAVQAVLQGKQFVGSGLTGRILPLDTETYAYGSHHDDGIHGKPQPIEDESRRNHEVQFYSEDASLPAGFASFLEAALKAGNAGIVVATESHRESLLHILQAQGVDVATAIEEGRFISLDAAEMLSTFMVNDLPDPVRLFKVAGELLAGAARAAKGDHPRISVCAECAPYLCAQGKADAAIQLEHLCNEITKTYEVDILCGYMLESFQRESHIHIYERICAEHSAVRI